MGVSRHLHDGGDLSKELVAVVLSRHSHQTALEGRALRRGTCGMPGPLMAPSGNWRHFQHPSFFSPFSTVFVLYASWCSISGKWRKIILCFTVTGIYLSALYLLASLSDRLVFILCLSHRFAHFRYSWSGFIANFTHSFWMCLVALFAAVFALGVDQKEHF